VKPKPVAEFLEMRNALILSLRDHDHWLRENKKRPGEDRAAIVGLLTEMGVSCWTFREGPWIP
jgi:hypothetical protein